MYAESTHSTTMSSTRGVTPCLGLTVAPVVLQQSGTRLVLTEYGPKSRAAKGAVQ